MALPQEKFYTVEDYYSLPEDTRAELINGQFYNMSAPSRVHQEILGYLYRKIADYIDSKKGTCKVYPAPFAVQLNELDKTVVEPDISIICDPNKLTDRGCTGAPDWIIEITSPGNPSNDYIKKFNLYQSAKVREYWIVDPQNESIAVCPFNQNDPAINYTFKDKIKVNIYDDLYIDFNELNF